MDVCCCMVLASTLPSSRYCISVRLSWVRMVEFAPWQEACQLIAPHVDVFCANGISVVL